MKTVKKEKRTVQQFLSKIWDVLVKCMRTGDKENEHPTWTVFGKMSGDAMTYIKAFRKKWAATWQNQQSDCASSEDSDKPRHPPSLIRVFAVRIKKAWILKLATHSAHSEAHTHFVGFVMSWLKCSLAWEIMLPYWQTETRGSWATTLIWMYSYEGCIQPKYCKCCMHGKNSLSFALATNQIQQFGLNSYAQGTLL